MNELEKVIKGLKCCIRSDREVFCSGRCPYYDDQSNCETKVKQDAVRLLKEQKKEIEILKLTLQQFPEITVLTDEPLYRIEKGDGKYTDIAGRYRE